MGAQMVREVASKTSDEDKRQCGRRHDQDLKRGIDTAGRTSSGSFREGRVAEVAAYCETDVVNTYRLWLRYELFRGRLTENGLRESEASLGNYTRSHSDAKPHVAYLQARSSRGLGLDVPLEVQSEGDGEIFIPNEPGT
jgi:hypothetical protein